MLRPYFIYLARLNFMLLDIPANHRELGFAMRCFRCTIDTNLREDKHTRHMFVTYLQVDFQATIMDARRDRRPIGALRDIKITYEGLARVDGSARFSSGKDGFCVSFA